MVPLSRPFYAINKIIRTREMARARALAYKVFSLFLQPHYTGRTRIYKRETKTDRRFFSGDS